MKRQYVTVYNREKAVRSWRVRSPRHKKHVLHQAESLAAQLSKESMQHVAFVEDKPPMGQNPMPLSSTAKVGRQLP